MEIRSTRQGTVFSGPRSWWWIPAAALVLGSTVAAGMAAKSLGTVPAEVGVDVALSHGRNSALVLLSQVINFGTARRGRSCSCWPSVRTCSGSGEGRSRPPVDALGSLASETGASFPSGHTAFAVALVLAIAVVLARTTAHRVVVLTAGALLVVLVAFSWL